MNIKQGEKNIKKFIRNCDKDNDSFLIVHFSICEDTYKGHFNIDFADALIIIKHLLEHFNIDKRAL